MFWGCRAADQSVWLDWLDWPSLGSKRHSTAALPNQPSFGHNYYLFLETQERRPGRPQLTQKLILIWLSQKAL